MTEDPVLFLCDEKELRQEQLGYARAFRRHGEVIHWRGQDLLFFLRQSKLKPKLILFPEISAFLPWGLTEINIPTACFQIDTFGRTSNRIRHSMLFDYAFVFHPGFDRVFREGGHPNAILLAHAVEQEPFRDLPDERIYEVGWVGLTEWKNYARRQRILPQLAKKFKMNPWQRKYNRDEMAQVYKSSKIVVNISRDDYPQDANLRVFEAMAAGALLITGVPTELSQLGFEEGKHFIGYQDEEKIAELAAYYLSHDRERQDISLAGREKVLAEHTYYNRVELILKVLKQNEGKFFAPARGWREEGVRQLYLEYYANCSQLDNAWGQLRHLKKIGYPQVLKALPFVAITLLRVLRNFLLRRKKVGR